jgi:hypothetical protein
MITLVRLFGLCSLRVKSFARLGLSGFLLVCFFLEPNQQVISRNTNG